MKRDTPYLGAISGRFPHFFVLGGPKCGTTTIYEMLRGHAGIDMPRKEPSTLSQDVEVTLGLKHQKSIDTIEEYAALYGRAADGMVTGEATPRTLYSRQAFDLIAAHRPDGQFIAVVRDPVDLALSYHAQKLREGIETETNFERAWRRGVDEAGDAVSDAPYIDGAINYTFWARYGVHLARWRARYGKDQLLILTLSDLKDIVAAYQRILAHIGVADDGRTEFDVANERIEMRSYLLNRMAIKTVVALHPMLEPLRRLKGGSLGGLKVLNAFNTVPNPRGSSVSEALRAFMIRTIDEDVRLAEEIVGRPLLRRP